MEKTPLELCKQKKLKRNFVTIEEIGDEIDILSEISYDYAVSLSDVIAISKMLELRRQNDFNESVKDQKDEQVYGIALLLSEIAQELRNMNNLIEQ